MQGWNLLIAATMGLAAGPFVVPSDVEGGTKGVR